MEHRMKGRDSFTDGLILATIDLTAILLCKTFHPSKLKKRTRNSSLLVTVIACGFKAQRCQENHRSTAEQILAKPPVQAAQSERRMLRIPQKLLAGRGM